MNSREHEVATRAAHLIIKELEGSRWEDIALSCESTIAIVVATVAVMAGSQSPERFAQEIIETMTERAHSRVLEYIRKNQG